MRKKRILVIIIFILIVVVITMKILITNTTAKQTEEVPQDILYQDVIITALTPTIKEAIDDYYKNVLSYLPTYDSSRIKILNIEQPNGDQTRKFIINIEVMPYVGPHLTVGSDRISIALSYSGIQKILSFEHVKNYPLPEHYQNIYLQ